MSKHRTKVARALVSLWLPLAPLVAVAGCGGHGSTIPTAPVDMAPAMPSKPHPDMAHAPINCSEALSCQLQCKDAICVQGCFSNATPAAKLDLLALSYCLYQTCGSSGDGGAGCTSLGGGGPECLACIGLAVGDASRDGRPCHDELVNCLYD